MSYYGYIDKSNCLAHHGIKGQKWGIRRYQNEDGSLTEAGRRRYGVNYINKNPEKRLKSARAFRGNAKMYADVYKHIKKSSPQGLSSKAIDEKVKDYYNKHGMSDTYNRDKSASNFHNGALVGSTIGSGVGASAGAGITYAINEGLIDTPLELPMGAGIGLGNAIGSFMGSTIGGLTKMKDYKKWKEETDRIVDDLLDLNRRDTHIKGQKESIEFVGFEGNKNFKSSKINKGYLNNLIKNNSSISKDLKDLRNYYKVEYENTKNGPELIVSAVLDVPGAGPMGQPVEYIFDANTKKLKETNWV